MNSFMGGRHFCIPYIHIYTVFILSYILAKLILAFALFLLPFCFLDNALCLLFNSFSDFCRNFGLLIFTPLDSKNRAKARLMVAKTHEKVANQRNDFIHKVSTAITKQFDTIVIETLNIRGMKKNHSLAKSISNVSWSRFFQFLKYKTEKQGKNVIEIGMFEKSSKTCSVCGHVNNYLTLKEREWICKNCKTKLDRDVNAAINIRNFGLKQIRLNQIPSDRGEFKPVENPLTAELAKMKILVRSASHDPEKQEPSRQSITAEAHAL